MEPLEKGISLLKQEKFAEAIACLREVVEKEPTNQRALHYLATAYARSSDYANAELVVRRLLTLLPESPVVWCNLGTALRKQGRFNEARAAQLGALALEPHYQKARVELLKIDGDQQRASGNISSSVHPSGRSRAAPRTVPRSPKTVRALLVVTAVVVLLAALAATLARAWATSAPSLLRQAYAAHSQGDFRRACRLYRRVVEKDDSLAMACLAAAYAEMRINPFGELDQIHPQSRSSGLLPSNGSTDTKRLVARLRDATVKASFGLTAQLDAADAWARVGLKALQDVPLEEEVTMGFGVTAAEVASLCHTVLADTATLRAAANLLRFCDRVDRILRAEERNLSGAIASLHQVYDLQWAIEWGRIGLYHARQAVAYDRHNDEVTNVLLTCQEIETASWEISGALRDLGELARIVGR